MRTRFDRTADLRSLENPGAAWKPRGDLARAEREARTHRVLVIGALASFVGFFGLAAAGNIAQSVAPRSTVVGHPPAVVAAAPTPTLAATAPPGSVPSVMHPAASSTSAALPTPVSPPAVIAPAPQQPTQVTTATS